MRSQALKEDIVNAQPSHRHPRSGVLSILALSVAALIISACGAPAPPTEIPVDPTPQPSPTTRIEPDSPLPTPAPESPLPTPAAPQADSPLPTPTPFVEATPTPDDQVLWVADGVITEGEYDQHIDFGDIRLWWTHDGTHLYLAMEGDTEGWVAVGINPEFRMQGADYIFGYVENGEALIWDAYGTAPTVTHPPDEELGGTNDIVEFAGVEEDGVTRFEVKKLMDSGDPYDQLLEPGMSYPIIVAIGAEDDFDAYHLRYDRGELTLLPQSA